MSVLAVAGVAALILPSLLAHSSNSGQQVSTISVMHTARYGDVLVVGAGPLRGFPLYEFSGDVAAPWGCGRQHSSGFDFSAVSAVPLTCSGPMSDMANAVKTDDWPAFTSQQAPQVTSGVAQRLVGRSERRGIGDQVTYDGHPLYLYDPPSAPFAPQGELYAETVAPMAPWHGYWYLVSAATGSPAPGVATLEVATLPNGAHVLGEEVDFNLSRVAEALYGLSSTSVNSACDAACEATWVPVLTSGTPVLSGGVPRNLVGTIRLANGTTQVTFEGRRLYLYSREKFFLGAHATLGARGTGGNGQNLTSSLGRYTLISLTSAASSS